MRHAARLTIGAFAWVLAGATTAGTPSHVGDLQPGQGYAGDYFTGLRRTNAGNSAPFIFIDAANTGYVVIDGQLHTLRLVGENGKLPNLDRSFADGDVTAKEHIHGKSGTLTVTVGTESERIPVSVEIS